MSPLSYLLKKWMPILATDARWNILTVLILHANERNRCWPTMDTLAELGSHGNRARATRAKKWLEAHGALELVPSKLRVGKEKSLPGRQHVYQLTGIFTHCDDPECKCRNYPTNTPYYYLHEEVKSSTVETIKSSTVETIKSSTVETQSIPSSNPIKEKDLSPVGDGHPSLQSKNSTPQTTVVHFQDVKDHWNVDTQTWDDDRYVYIGRRHPEYGLPDSDWRNPYLVSSYIQGAAPDDEAKACAVVTDMYTTLLNSPKAISLYNRLPELRERVLVDTVSPELSHGAILAALANKKGWRPKDAWFEAVSRHFGITNGARVGALVKMLQGKATDASHVKYNIDPPLRDPSDLDAFMNWYRQEKPDMPLESQDTINKNIDLWRTWKLKRAEAARPPEQRFQPPGTIVQVSFEPPEPVRELTDEEKAEAQHIRDTMGKALREKLAQEAAEKHGGKAETEADWIRKNWGRVIDEMVKWPGVFESNRDGAMAYVLDSLSTGAITREDNWPTVVAVIHQQVVNAPGNEDES